MCGKCVTYMYVVITAKMYSEPHQERSKPTCESDATSSAMAVCGATGAEVEPKVKSNRSSNKEAPPVELDDIIKPAALLLLLSDPAVGGGPNKSSRSCPWAALPEVAPSVTLSSSSSKSNRLFRGAVKRSDFPADGDPSD